MTRAAETFAGVKRNIERVKGKETMYRQGDIFIFAVDEEITGQAIEREQGRVVLAHGEATGHAHAFTDPSVGFFSIPESEDRHLRLVKPTTLLHEEHGPITIPPGTYRVRRQREYSPKEIRTVVD
jgi:hypothetical protein